MVNWEGLALIDKAILAVKWLWSLTRRCPGPQLLRFHAYVGADKTSRLDAQAAEVYGTDDVVGCYGLYVQGKNATDDDWYTIDDIFEVIKWIADGWYEGEPYIEVIVLGQYAALPPRETYTLEKRSTQIPREKTRAFSDLPRLIELRTVGTYDSIAQESFMPIMIATRDDEDRQWNTSPGGANYWQYVLEWLQRRHYRIVELQSPNRCLLERV